MILTIILITLHNSYCEIILRHACRLLTIASTIFSRNVSIYRLCADDVDNERTFYLHRQLLAFNVFAVNCLCSHNVNDNDDITTRREFSYIRTARCFVNWTSVSRAALKKRMRMNTRCRSGSRTGAPSSVEMRGTLSHREATRCIIIPSKPRRLPSSLVAVRAWRPARRDWRTSSRRRRPTGSPRHPRPSASTSSISTTVRRLPRSNRSLHLPLARLRLPLPDRRPRRLECSSTTESTSPATIIIFNSSSSSNIHLHSTCRPPSPTRRLRPPCSPVRPLTRRERQPWLSSSVLRRRLSNRAQAAATAADEVADGPVRRGRQQRTVRNARQVTINTTPVCRSIRASRTTRRSWRQRRRRWRRSHPGS